MGLSASSPPERGPPAAGSSVRFYVHDILRMPRFYGVVGEERQGVLRPPLKLRIERAGGLPPDLAKLEIEIERAMVDYEEVPEVHPGERVGLMFGGYEFKEFLVGRVANLFHLKRGDFLVAP